MDRRTRTFLSLQGLSVGDAFGEAFFFLPQDQIASRQLPPAPWRWTDDTHMALSVVEVLLAHGAIEPDALAAAFAHRFRQDPRRGYGAGARLLLARYARGADWRAEAPRLFDGGSWGNGGAMRAAPIGAFFVGDPARAAAEARQATAVTHAHPEGQAGAMAVAAAAAMVSSPQAPGGEALLRAVAAHLPASRTRQTIEAAAGIPAGEHHQAVTQLGTGQQVAAFDTVPFCLWVVAHHSPDYATALWTTVAGRGDRDTTCAIVGGIVGPRTGVPPAWQARREPLPEPFTEV